MSQCLIQINILTFVLNHESFEDTFKTKKYHFETDVKQYKKLCKVPANKYQLLSTQLV